MSTTVEQDYTTLKTALFPVIADQFCSKDDTDEPTRERIMRGLAIAQSGKLGRAEQYDQKKDKVWEVMGSKGTSYTVWNGQCGCESAKRVKHCKHRYAIGIFVQAAKDAQAIIKKARYAQLNGEDGIVWPTSLEDLMFMRTDGTFTGLDPEAAFGKDANFGILGYVVETVETLP